MTSYWLYVSSFPPFQASYSDPMKLFDTSYGIFKSGREDYFEVDIHTIGIYYVTYVEGAQLLLNLGVD